MKIALCGINGKMGRAAYEVLHSYYEIIGVDQNTAPLKEVIHKVDYVIDFTKKDVALNHIYICLDTHTPFICGTTGFSSDELAHIKMFCHRENVKGVICYNFSLVINYLLKHLQDFKTYFEQMEYFDIHPTSKKDKVSGTTMLFLLQNSKIKVKNVQNHKNSITYILKMSSKYDKIVLTYQVTNRKAYAIGLLVYLLTHQEGIIVNLLA